MAIGISSNGDNGFERADGGEERSAGTICAAMVGDFEDLGGDGSPTGEDLGLYGAADIAGQHELDVAMGEQDHHGGVIGSRIGESGNRIENVGGGAAPGVFTGVLGDCQREALVGHGGGEIRPGAGGAGIATIDDLVHGDIGGVENVDQAADMVTVRMGGDHQVDIVNGMGAKVGQHGWTGGGFATIDEDVVVVGVVQPDGVTLAHVDEGGGEGGGGRRRIILRHARWRLDVASGERGGGGGGKENEAGGKGENEDK